ncbi:MAG: FkbM family methyltransferase [Bdellovibrionota bacterium]
MQTTTTTPTAKVRKPRSARLPQGETFYCVDSREVPMLYREIFEDEAYVKHGIKITPKMTVFDVGANIGMFTYYLAKRCPDATIYSFEPLPPTFAALNKNVSELHLTNVKPINVGLSKKASQAEFTFYPYSAGWSTMYSHDTPEFREIMIKNMMAYDRLPAPIALAFKVPGLGRLVAKSIIRVQLSHQKFQCNLRTLSEIIRENKVEKIDLLKVDVERAELDVLLGIEDAHWPKISQAVVEVQSDKDPENCRKISELLKSKGFRVVEEMANYLLDETGKSTNSTLYAFRD